jgi:hypothetical protein
MVCRDDLGFQTVKKMLSRVVFLNFFGSSGGSAAILHPHRSEEGIKVPPAE